MVEINFDQSRPSSLLDLSHLDELDSWANDERAHTPRLWFKKQGVRDVDRFASMLIPGWRL